MKTQDLDARKPSQPLCCHFVSTNPTHDQTNGIFFFYPKSRIRSHNWQTHKYKQVFRSQVLLRKIYANIQTCRHFLCKTQRRHKLTLLSRSSKRNRGCVFYGFKKRIFGFTPLCFCKGSAYIYSAHRFLLHV